MTLFDKVVEAESEHWPGARPPEQQLWHPGGWGQLTPAGWDRVWRVHVGGHRFDRLTSPGSDDAAGALAW